MAAKAESTSFRPKAAGARRWVLSPYWRLQLPGLSATWVIGFVYCEAFFLVSWKAIVMATWTTGIVGVTSEVLHAHYRRLAARAPGTLPLFARVAVACVAAGMATSALASSLDGLFHLNTSIEQASDHIVGCILITSFFYTSWSVLYFALKHKAAATAAQDQLREVQALATQAELAMLRYQLNPHFLFNSLTSLRQQIIEDAEKARTMTGELANYLRHTLRDSARQETTLGEELRATESYLALEKMRFEERLDVTFDVEAAARDWQVPTFLLQPLVENAVKHGGPGRKELPLRLRIEARVESGALHIVVGNTGLWREAHSRPDGGIGLVNLHRRLHALYPDRHEVIVGAEDDGWVRARIAIFSPA